MNFDLVRPCPHCPFRVDCKQGWLGEDRAEEIANSLLTDYTFLCHETVEHDEDGEPFSQGENVQHCAGAMIFLEHQEQPNQMMRWMERIGYYDKNKLDMDAPVFDDYNEFIDHHTKD